MPRLDKTGPRGLGPKTGQGLGDCQISENMVKSNSQENEQTSNFVYGRGLGLGRGCRRKAACGRGRKYN